MDDLARYAEYFGRPSPEVRRDLESFAALLRKWTAVQNLVSRETVAHLWDRHIIDSLQLLPLIGPEDRAILDLGSGGGLPAIPLAIALKGRGHQLQLVEPIAKKVAFLRQAARELQLPAAVHAGRSTDFDSRETLWDVVTSRALASLPELLRLIHPFFTPKTRAILHKGREHAAEIAESRLAWEFDVVIHPSVTDDAGVVLEISHLDRRSS